MIIRLYFLLELLGGAALMLAYNVDGVLRVVVLFAGWGLLRWGFHREFKGCHRD